MGAQIKNPRKKFLWSINFPKHPLNPYLCQNVTLPDIDIEEVTHGDINRDVKTAGRVTIGDMTVEKLVTTSGSDTWVIDWVNACQDHVNGGGLVPSQYWETVIVNELAEDGVSILNSWLLQEVWPKKVTGINLDRTASENTIENMVFSVGTLQKY